MYLMTCDECKLAIGEVGQPAAFFYKGLILCPTHMEKTDLAYYKTLARADADLRTRKLIERQREIEARQANYL